MNRIPRYTTDALESDGYEVIRSPLSYGIAAVHGVRFTSEGGVEGGADPGQDGVALGVWVARSSQHSSISPESREGRLIDMAGRVETAVRNAVSEGEHLLTPQGERRSKLASRANPD